MRMKLTLNKTQSRIQNSSGTGACEPKRFCPDTVMASCTITNPSIMSSNQPSGSTPGFQNPNSELYKSVKDIFPVLPDWKILNALQNTEDLEAAVTKLCDDRTGGSCDQFHSYSSVIKENEAELWESDEFNEPQEHCVEDQGNIYPKLMKLSQQCVQSGNKIRLKLRRSNIWEDTVTTMKRLQKEGLNGLVTVQFIGEPAVDEEGPRKEFFFPNKQTHTASIKST